LCIAVKTILAAIDFSPVTEAVVAEAIALARAAPARLILLNVTTPKSLLTDYAALAAVLERTEPQQGSSRHVAAVHGDSLQIIGKPIQVILEQAQRFAADYIVMGCHGHTALFKFVVGGTAAGVIRGAKCPVILIPPGTGKTEKRAGRGYRLKDPIRWLERADSRSRRPPQLKRRFQRRPSSIP
jgi:nucleotide-binding universal stress UspA family protein